MDIWVIAGLWLREHPSMYVLVYLCTQELCVCSVLVVQSKRNGCTKLHPTSTLVLLIQILSNT